MLAWCKELADAARVPAMILSAGADHTTFCRQAEIACRGGASGFLPDRSIRRTSQWTWGPLE
jgi:tagatose 1,6-diphosphate aldolase